MEIRKFRILCKLVYFHTIATLLIFKISEH